MPKPAKPAAAKPRRVAKFRDWLTSAVGGAVASGGGVALLVGAFFIFDDRYAHAADVGKQIEVNRLSAEISNKENRKDYLTDKVYDLAAKKAQQRGRLAPNEEVSLQRYSVELNAVAGEIAAKQRLRDRVQTGK